MLRCPIDLYSTLYANIVLTGGNTRFPGFRERMRKEMSIYANKIKVKVSIPDDICIEHPAWTGGERKMQPSLID